MREKVRHTWVATRCGNQGVDHAKVGGGRAIVLRDMTLDRMYAD